ncbi:MAG: hypothetical protein BA863_06055 [Desulfovibrio sp. S3730MH75]|nr:MAG: hypothetical protein BA863_06055 [Desulfovibrio sp. S3730MH75]
MFDILNLPPDFLKNNFSLIIYFAGAIFAVMYELFTQPHDGFSAQVKVYWRRLRDILANILVCISIPFSQQPFMLWIHPYPEWSRRFFTTDNYYTMKSVCHSGGSTKYLPCFFSIYSKRVKWLIGISAIIFLALLYTLLSFNKITPFTINQDIIWGMWGAFFLFIVIRKNMKWFWITTLFILLFIVKQVLTFYKSSFTSQLDLLSDVSIKFELINSLLFLGLGLLLFSHSKKNLLRRIFIVILFGITAYFSNDISIEINNYIKSLPKSTSIIEGLLGIFGAVFISLTIIPAIPARDYHVCHADEKNKKDIKCLGYLEGSGKSNKRLVNEYIVLAVGLIFSGVAVFLRVWGKVFPLNNAAEIGILFFIIFVGFDFFLKEKTQQIKLPVIDVILLIVVLILGSSLVGSSLVDASLVGSSLLGAFLLVSSFLVAYLVGPSLLGALLKRVDSLIDVSRIEDLRVESISPIKALLLGASLIGGVLVKVLLIVFLLIVLLLISASLIGPLLARFSHLYDNVYALIVFGLLVLGLTIKLISTLYWSNQAREYKSNNNNHFQFLIIICLALIFILSKTASLGYACSWKEDLVKGVLLVPLSAILSVFLFSVPKFFHANEKGSCLNKLEYALYLWPLGMRAWSFTFGFVLCLPLLFINKYAALLMFLAIAFVCPWVRYSLGRVPVLLDLWKGDAFFKSFIEGEAMLTPKTKGLVRYWPFRCLPFAPSYANYQGAYGSRSSLYARIALLQLLTVTVPQSVSTGDETETDPNKKSFTFFLFIRWFNYCCLPIWTSFIALLIITAGCSGMIDMNSIHHGPKVFDPESNSFLARYVFLTCGVIWLGLSFKMISHELSRLASLTEYNSTDGEGQTITPLWVKVRAKKSHDTFSLLYATHAQNTLKMALTVFASIYCVILTFG